MTPKCLKVKGNFDIPIIITCSDHLNKTNKIQKDVPIWECYLLEFKPQMSNITLECPIFSLATLVGMFRIHKFNHRHKIIRLLMLRLHKLVLLLLFWFHRWHLKSTYFICKVGGFSKNKDLIGTKVGWLSSCMFGQSGSLSAVYLFKMSMAMTKMKKAAFSVLDNL